MRSTRGRSVGSFKLPPQASRPRGGSSAQARCRSPSSPPWLSITSSCGWTTPSARSGASNYAYDALIASARGIVLPLVMLLTVRAAREPLARPPEIGPPRMRVLPARDNGREEDRSGEAATPHPRPDNSQAARGRADARPGLRGPRSAKALEVSEQTFHRWRAQYGGMKADDAKRLRELERENARLKRIVADKELEADALREVAKGRMKVKFARALALPPSSRRVGGPRRGSGTPPRPPALERDRSRVAAHG